MRGFDMLLVVVRDRILGVGDSRIASIVAQATIPQVYVDIILVMALVYFPIVTAG